MQRQNKNNKIIIGLTGSFGSGKSTVARIFSSFGATVIDADKIAHNSIKRSGKIFKEIVSCFGSKVVKKNGEIDRKKLGEIVFNSKRSLMRLNNIVHPEVIKSIKKEIDKKKKGVIVLDAPLLLEAGLRKMVDVLVVVSLDQNKQINRLMRKSSLARSDIIKRIKFQAPMRLKKRMADFIIDNSGSLKDTHQQAAIIRRKLWKS